jgi:ABC-2 type transport system permease protein
MRLYWVLFRTSTLERLMYRGDFAFATLMRFLPIITQIFLWGAIYGVREGVSTQRLNGYSYADMVAYYLLAMVGRAFSSMPGLSSGIAREIRDGTLKKYLTQPVDMLGYLFCARAAHKAIYYLVATGPFVLVFYLCRSFFDYQPDLPTIAAFGLALLAAFLIGFLLESLVGLIAFWFLEVSSLIFIYMMLTYFLSGHMLPLDWLPAPFGNWVQYLPFKYLAHYPAAVMLGKYTHAELASGTAVAAIWVVILFGINRLVFAWGLRRYGAYGG